MNTISDKNSIEYQIVERQLAMKDSQEKSSFNYIKAILETYNMPSTTPYLTNIPPNQNGKNF